MHEECSWQTGRNSANRDEGLLASARSRSNLAAAIMYHPFVT